MRIAVVGDLLLDVDASGSGDRVSPDLPGPWGPAPVIDVERAATRAGGAGLVATLLHRDGHDVRLISALGADAAAARLLAALPERVERVLGATRAPTPVKLRLRVEGHTRARVDFGCAPPPLPAVDVDLAGALDDVDAVVVADYGRGVTRTATVRAALARAGRDLPVVWDPHRLGAEPTAGVTVATPNRGEAADRVRRFDPELAAQLLDGDRPSPRLAAAAARALRRAWASRAVAVTLGEDGLALCAGSGAAQTSHVVRAPAAAVADPCGAGDRLSSAVAAGLAAGEPLVAAFERAAAITADFLRDGGVATLADTTTEPIRVRRAS